MEDWATFLDTALGAGNAVPILQADLAEVALGGAS